MNEGKVGAPFEYSHRYIHFLAFLKIGFQIACRTVQGIVRGLSDYIKIEEMHLTHIRRRILKIKPQLNLGSVDDNKPVTLMAVDVTDRVMGIHTCESETFIDFHFLIFCRWIYKEIIKEDLLKLYN